MKKIIYSLLAPAMLLSSCSMDEMPVGVIDPSNAIQSVADCRSYLVGINSGLRGAGGGGWITYGELQSDLFQATITNGNRNGVFATGDLTAGTSELAGPFNTCYVRISEVNYFLPYAQALLDNGTVTKDEDVRTVRRCIAKALFARGYYYWYLLDHYSPAPTEANRDQAALGAMLVTEYNPTADRGSYPGRSTIGETLTRIYTDLDDAYAIFKEYEADDMSELGPDAIQVNSCVVEALKARVKLLEGTQASYQEAFNLATGLINNGDYELCARADYKEYWISDTSTENIFLPYSELNESAPTTGGIYLYNSQYNTSDFIPSPNVLSLYNRTQDIRYAAFYLSIDFDNDGDIVEIPCFNKFPGNPALMAPNTNSFKNRPKMFRLSEQYLIAAETAYYLNQATTACDYLNELAKARHNRYTNRTLEGTALFDAIKEERMKELVGEGFRISDLKRWNMGFTRTFDYTVVMAKYADVPSLLYTTTRGLSYQPGDYRLVWPIPTSEMDVNPQLKGQQNPGYGF